MQRWMLLIICVGISRLTSSVDARCRLTGKWYPKLAIFIILLIICVGISRLTSSVDARRRLTGKWYPPSLPFS